MSSNKNPGFLCAVLCGFAGFLMAGLLIARLTLSANPRVHASFGDTLTLFLFLGLLYAMFGAALGVLAGAGVRLLQKILGDTTLARVATTGTFSALLLGPLAYFATLPAVGLTQSFLGDLVFGGGKVKLLVVMAVTCLVLGLIGVAVSRLLSGLAERFGMRLAALVSIAWVLATLTVLAGGLFFRPEAGAGLLGTGGGYEDGDVVLPETPPNPVVLINIDGADLPNAIQPMVAEGELPTFARLLEESTWGELATIEPTRSHTIWTSIITGKTPRAHGVRNFTILRVPGLKNNIEELPLHTGLNKAIPGILNRLIPGMPSLHAPYTSNMRRAEALWTIVSRYYPVGSYQWLISWPAEPVNGFCVAGGMRWAQYVYGFEDEHGKELAGGAVYPEDIFDGLDLPSRPDVSWEQLRPYVGTDDIDRDDNRLNFIAKTLQDPTAQVVPALMEKYQTKFAAVSFYSVDSFGHLFARYKDKGVPFSTAIDQSYRLTDRRLGEFLERLDENTNVIIISDHGWDFEKQHHIFAPPGVFFGYGPAFDKGRQVEGLSIFDVAPLALRLLSLPVPDDMIATDAGQYENTLTSAFVTEQPEVRIASYETGEVRDHGAIDSELDEEIVDVLRSLGYIE